MCAVAAVLLMVVLAVGAGPAAAATPAPPFSQCPAVGADTSCALLIYIDGQGRVAVLGDPTQGPYDGVEDTLIGVQNDSSSAIAGIPLSATTGKDLFGFDGDGLCAYQPDPGCPFGPTGYEGPGTSFTGISSDLTSGTVVFAPALKPGQHTYFSLEEALATVPPFDIDTGPPTPADHMVALGDSYSAGEGLGNYEAGTDIPGTNQCHRTSLAYGPLLDSELSLGTLTFKACSGAVTADLLAANHSNQGEPAQLDALNDGSATTVTLTIGGNDLGFSELAHHCIFGKFAAIVIPGTHAGCRNEKTLVAATKARLSALDGKGTATSPDGSAVKPVLDLLREAHRRAPGAFIYIGSYPTPLGTFKGECGIGHLTAVGAGLRGATKLNGDDAAWLDSLVVSLNAVIKRATDTAQTQGIPAFYVNVDPFFEGHRLCDGHGDEWIGEISGQVNLRTKELFADPSSLHPTADGQRRGYEAAFNDAITANGF